jgi:hypothetical protein
VNLKTFYLLFVSYFREKHKDQETVVTMLY